MSLKKIGYYIVKGKCVKAYAKKKRNRAGKLVTKKVLLVNKVCVLVTKLVTASVVNWCAGLFQLTQTFF